MQLNHLTILTGAYGSGKTECALALALQAAAAAPVTLIDLDFVNPYFRAQDHAAMLAAQGVTLLAPPADRAAIDAPALPPGTRDALCSPRGRTIVDLGGDPLGATVFGQFAPGLGACDLWAVVNFARPTTPDPPTAAALLGEMVTAARLPLTGLISNTHLGGWTTAKEVCAGLAAARALGDLLGVPVVCAGAPAGLALPPLEVPLLSLALRLKRPWEH